MKKSKYSADCHTFVYTSCGPIDVIKSDVTVRRDAVAP